MFTRILRASVIQRGSLDWESYIPVYGSSMRRWLGSDGFVLGDTNAFLLLRLWLWYIGGHSGLQQRDRRVIVWHTSIAFGYLGS